MRLTLYLLLMALISCETRVPCNPEYGNLEDAFPDEAILEMGYTRAIVSLDKAMDSITDEVHFDSKHGGTLVWYQYSGLKLDSSGNKTIYENDEFGNIVSEVDIIAQVNIHSEGSYTISENGESTDYDPITTKTVYWKDTTRILKYNKDSNVALYFKPTGALYLKQIYLKNKCGYEYEIQAYDSLDSLEYLTKAELNDDGWPVRTSKFDAQGNKLGVQSSTFLNGYGQVKTEKLILEDTLYRQKLNTFDQNGLIIKSIIEYAENGYSIMTQHKRDTLGLPLRQIIVQANKTEEISRDTFYYFYFKN